MSDELSDLIRRAVRRGSMSHLTVVTSDGIVFQAAWRGVDGPDYRMVDSTDPVDALVCALTGRRPLPMPAPAPEKKARRTTRRHTASPAPAAGGEKDDFDDVFG